MSEAPIEKWFRDAPPGIQAWMATPDFLAFVREQHAKSFKMIGLYDGAMSEQCKQRFREQYEAIGGLQMVVKGDK